MPSRWIHEKNPQTRNDVPRTSMVYYNDDEKHDHFY